MAFHTRQFVITKQVKSVFVYVQDLARCALPHCHFFGQGDETLGLPGREHHMSSGDRVPYHQTSQQTGRGM